jgi:hypothetical protein
MRGVAIRLVWVLLALAGPFSAAAAARGFVSLHFGLPLAVAPPVYYVPPPVYVYPPAVAYPVAVAPPVVTTCHEYQSTAMINGTPQPVYGRVCQQPDGSWRIVP